MTRAEPTHLNRLSPLAITRVSAPGWYADGGGLYLEVSSSGRKRWAMRITINGRRRDFGLGPLHKVSLQQARVRAMEYRNLAFAGVDPSVPEPHDGQSQSSISFEDASYAAHRARKGNWSNGKHVSQWINTLRDHAFPLMGAKDVNKIATADILQVLTPIWTAKPETARRLRQRIRVVFEWCRAAGHRTGDNPIDGIGEALPKHQVRVHHHEALPYADVPKFLIDLGKGLANDVTKDAFGFLILTTVRTTEVRFARSSEINVEKALWTIPPDRMKARREHVVPLSRQALAIVSVRLANPDHQNKDALIFADPTTGEALSENRFLNARTVIGYADRCTPHGFRSSFRDWAAEETNYPPEVAERALAHTIKSKTEAAYRRGILLEKRRHLMQAWADFCYPKVASPE